MKAKILCTYFRFSLMFSALISLRSMSLIVRVSPWPRFFSSNFILPNHPARNAAAMATNTNRTTIEHGHCLQSHLLLAVLAVAGVPCRELCSRTFSGSGSGPSRGGEPEGGGGERPSAVFSGVG